MKKNFISNTLHTMGSESWQLRCAELKQRGAYLFQSKLWSDCTFQLDSMTIKAHKLIMAMASPVFSQMLYGSFVKFPMPIYDVRPEVFNIMLEYIYSDNLNIDSSKDACDLYYAAKKWRIPYLAKRCAMYLSDHMSPDNVCQIYEVACETGDCTLQKTCEKIFSTRTKEILNDKSFYEVDLNVVKKLFSLDPLDIDSELDLFEAIVNYAKHQNQKTKERNILRRTDEDSISEHELPPTKKARRSLDATHNDQALNDDSTMMELEASPGNSSSCSHESHDTTSDTVVMASKEIIRVVKNKQIYQDLINLIRFLTLSPQEFAECSSLSSLLNDTDILALSMNIATRETVFEIPEGFSTCMVPRTLSTREDRTRLAAVFRSVIHNIKNIKKYESMPFYLRNLAWTLMMIHYIDKEEEVFVLGVTCFFEAGAPDWMKNSKLKIKLTTHKPVPKNLHKITFGVSEPTADYGAWVAKINREDLLNPDYGFVDDFNTVTYKLYINTVPRPDESPDVDDSSNNNPVSVVDMRLSNVVLRRSKSPISSQPTITSTQSVINTETYSSATGTITVQNCQPNCNTTNSQLRPTPSANVTGSISQSRPTVTVASTISQSIASSTVTGVLQAKPVKPISQTLPSVTVANTLPISTEISQTKPTTAVGGPEHSSVSIPRHMESRNVERYLFASGVTYGSLTRLSRAGMSINVIYYLFKSGLTPLAIKRLSETQLKPSVIVYLSQLPSDKIPRLNEKLVPLTSGSNTVLSSVPPSIVANLPPSQPDLAKSSETVPPSVSKIPSALQPCLARSSDSNTAPPSKPPAVSQAHLAKPSGLNTAPPSMKSIPAAPQSCFNNPLVSSTAHTSSLTKPCHGKPSDSNTAPPSKIDTPPPLQPCLAKSSNSKTTPSPIQNNPSASQPCLSKPSSSSTIPLSMVNTPSPTKPCLGKLSDSKTGLPSIVNTLSPSQPYLAKSSGSKTAPPSIINTPSQLCLARSSDSKIASPTKLNTPPTSQPRLIKPLDSNTAPPYMANTPATSQSCHVHPSGDNVHPSMVNTAPSQPCYDKPSNSNTAPPSKIDTPPRSQPCLAKSSNSKTTPSPIENNPSASHPCLPKPSSSNTTPLSMVNTARTQPCLRKPSDSNTGPPSMVNTSSPLQSYLAKSTGSKTAPPSPINTPSQLCLATSSDSKTASPTKLNTLPTSQPRLIKPLDSNTAPPYMTNTPAASQSCPSGANTAHPSMVNTSPSQPCFDKPSDSNTAPPSNIDTPPPSQPCLAKSSTLKTTPSPIENNPSVSQACFSKLSSSNTTPLSMVYISPPTQPCLGKPSDSNTGPPSVVNTPSPLQPYLAKSSGSKTAPPSMINTPSQICLARSSDSKIASPTKLNTPPTSQPRLIKPLDSNIAPPYMTNTPAASQSCPSGANTAHPTMVNTSPSQPCHDKASDSNNAPPSSQSSLSKSSDSKSACSSMNIIPQGSKSCLSKSSDSKSPPQSMKHTPHPTTAPPTVISTLPASQTCLAKPSDSKTVLPSIIYTSPTSEPCSTKTSDSKSPPSSVAFTPSPSQSCPDIPADSKIMPSSMTSVLPSSSQLCFAQPLNSKITSPSADASLPPLPRPDKTSGSIIASQSMVNSPSLQPCLAKSSDLQAAPTSTVNMPSLSQVCLAKLQSVVNSPLISQITPTKPADSDATSASSDLRLAAPLSSNIDPISMIHACPPPQPCLSTISHSTISLESSSLPLQIVPPKLRSLSSTNTLPPMQSSCAVMTNVTLTQSLSKDVLDSSDEIITISRTSLPVSFVKQTSIPLHALTRPWPTKRTATVTSTIASNKELSEEFYSSSKAKMVKRIHCAETEFSDSDKENNENQTLETLDKSVTLTRIEVTQKTKSEKHNLSIYQPRTLQEIVFSELKVLIQNEQFDKLPKSLHNQHAIENINLKLNSEDNKTPECKPKQLKQIALSELRTLIQNYGNR